MTFYLITRGFYRAILRGVACRQGMLTPPDTGPVPFRPLYVFHVESHRFSQLSRFFDLALRTFLGTFSYLLDKSNIINIQLVGIQRDRHTLPSYISPSNSPVEGRFRLCVTLLANQELSLCNPDISQLLSCTTYTATYHKKKNVIEIRLRGMTNTATYAVVQNRKQTVKSTILCYKVVACILRSVNFWKWQLPLNWRS